MLIKKNDFVEIEYTGRLKEENIIFDTTDEKVAKENNLGTERNIFGPIIICVGQQHVLKGLDNFLEGKGVEKFSVEIVPEDAFGKKDAKLIAMVPTRKFLEQKIQPMPGLRVNIDGAQGIIRTVNGGRCIVDFNHPLSGRVVVYDVKVNRIVTDKNEKVEALGKLLFGNDVKIMLDKDIARAEVPQDVPNEVAVEFDKKFEELVGVKFEFVKVEEKKDTNEGENNGQNK